MDHGHSIDGSYGPKSVPTIIHKIISFQLIQHSTRITGIQNSIPQESISIKKRLSGSGQSVQEKPIPNPKVKTLYLFYAFPFP